ncbi:hypothetical protein JCM3765_003014 [Sporobolomyces pararoseus]
MEPSLPPLPLPPTTNGNHQDDTAHPPPPPAPLARLDLEQELPNVTTDLIPLSYLIDRLITQSYSDFMTLLETLSSSPDQQRKQSIIDYVLQTRRQFLKLLVITRWSKESDRIKKIYNLIGFLTDQNKVFETCVESLKNLVEGLRNARVRNYDLETSLTVLQTGDYKFLPSNLSQLFKSQDKLDDDQVLETMNQVEQVMRWRLKMGKEELPIQLKDNYIIKDGRVIFKLKHLWKASFVYSGTEEEEGEWYLLKIEFLFKIKDGESSWNPTPTGPLKQHLIDSCNSQLALGKGKGTGKQLGRGFKFLTRLALSYQLESVFDQAVRLIRRRGRSGLKVEIDKERETVKLQYWIEEGEFSPGGTLIFSSSSSSSFGEREQQSLTINHLDTKHISNRRRKALENLLSSNRRSTSIEQEEQDSLDSSLQITYLPASSSIGGISIPRDFINDLVEYHDKEEEEEGFDLEKVLDKLTLKHAEETISVIAKELGIDNDDEDVVYDEEEGFIRLRLVGDYSISIHVDFKSGKIEFKSLQQGDISSSSSSSQENRLRSASERLNSLRFSKEGGETNWLKSLPEVISKIKATTILDKISISFSLLSLPTMRRLPLPPRELLKFGSLPSLALGRPTFLFVPLSINHGSSNNDDSTFEGFYLSVVVMQDFKIRFGLLETKEFNDPSGSGNSWIEINNEIGWINNDSSRKQGSSSSSSSSNFENVDSIGTELLRKIYNFSIDRILVYRLEQDLYSRQILYRSSSSNSNFNSNSNSTSTTNSLLINLEPTPPFLILDTKTLTTLPNRKVTSMLMRTAALRCQLDETNTTTTTTTTTTTIIKTTLHIRFNPTSLLSKLFSSSPQDIGTTIPLPLLLPKNVFYNPMTRTIVFLTESQDSSEFRNALENLLKAFTGFMKELSERVEKEEEEGKKQEGGKVKQG